MYFQEKLRKLYKQNAFNRKIGLFLVYIFFLKKKIKYKKNKNKKKKMKKTYQKATQKGYFSFLATWLFEEIRRRVSFWFIFFYFFSKKKKIKIK